MIMTNAPATVRVPEQPAHESVGGLLRDRKFNALLAAVVAVVCLEVLSLAGWDLPSPWAAITFTAFILGVGWRVLRKGVEALIRLRFSSINLLMLIATVAAFYLGQYAEAAVVIVLYTLGERLEDIGIRQSRSALDALVRKNPTVARVKGLDVEQPIETIAVGTILIVKPGESIPLDGVIEAGATSVDEAAITGEPLPKDKHVGESVFAGTLNKEGVIEVRTSKLHRDTTLSKIVRITFEAQQSKARTQKFIEQFSRVYTPSVLVIATLVVAVPVLFFNGSFDVWLLQGITLLVIACPCALVISTPVAIYAAIGNASRRGVLIKGGRYVELLAKIEAVALDKTRTITRGEPEISDVIPLGATTREELLACSAGAEVFSEHPLALAIVDLARRESVNPHSVQRVKSVIGKGLTAQCLVCEHKDILIGKVGYIRELMPMTGEAAAHVERLQKQGQTAVVVSFGSGVAGIFGVADAIKPESAQTVTELHRLGIAAVMLTGDNTENAAVIASAVGIRTVHGDLLPEDKAVRLQEMMAVHRDNVAMVGDGVNDAPALAIASVGIAMGAAGSDTAIETAPVALMNDKLILVPFLIRLGRRTLTTIRVNTALAIMVKVVFVALAVLGLGNLALAIAADVGVTLLVIVTSLRIMVFMPDVGEVGHARS
ncbi:MAG: cation-translocating P-type ATPase [Planctomycetes bacterium]|nr:cation-translocating P-type ATPase [Planctomycetota bacterium]